MRKKKKIYTSSLQRKIDYNNEYNKNHYKRIGFVCQKDKYKEIKDLLKKANMTQAEFIRWALDNLRKKMD